MEVLACGWERTSDDNPQSLKVTGEPVTELYVKVRHKFLQPCEYQS